MIIHIDVYFFVTSYKMEILLMKINIVLFLHSILLFFEYLYLFSRLFLYIYIYIYILSKVVFTCLDYNGKYKRKFNITKIC